MATHPIIHVEIPAMQSKESADFYARTFDWTMEHVPQQNYWKFAAEGGPDGGFAPVGAQPGTAINQLVVYIGADDIDATLSRIEANGGKILLPRTDIPGVGAFALFADLAGNKLGLFKRGV